MQYHFEFKNQLFNIKKLSSINPEITEKTLNERKIPLQAQIIFS